MTNVLSVAHVLVIFLSWTTDARASLLVLPVAAQSRSARR